MKNENYLFDPANLTNEQAAFIIDGLISTIGMVTKKDDRTLITSLAALKMGAEALREKNND
jgi:hypothetical protein